MTYIYYLEDPREAKRGYVGKANNLRVRYLSHLNEAKRNPNRKGRWILELIELGATPELVVLEEVEKGQWQEREKYWIAHLRDDLGHDLFNVLSGGDGRDSDEITTETRQRRAELNRIRYQDPEERKKQSLIMKAKFEDPEFRKHWRESHEVYTPEWRESLSKGQIARWQDNPEGRKERSEQSKIRWQDPEYQEKVAQGVRDAYQTEEMREWCSERTKGLWQQDEYREKVIKGVKESLKNEELIETHRRNTKGQWQDPEQRERRLAAAQDPERNKKVSEKAKARYADPEQRRLHSERMKKKWIIKRRKQFQQNVNTYQQLGLFPKAH